MKKLIMFGIVGILALSFISSANSQEIKDNIAEDQVIVCINGAVIEQSGNICTVVMADFDHPRTIQDIQQELYLNPDSDTFKMDVRD